MEKCKFVYSNLSLTNDASTGSGKTSLIKSIVQTCEDIVHVDSLPSVDSSLERRRSSRPHSGSVPTRGAAITEIYASTKPYPSWWSDLEDSRVLRRRKSIGEIVLERNLCFVDQPATSLSRAGQTDVVLQYMRQQLQRATTSLAGPGIDFQNLLAGNGGSQVDAILYLISNGMYLITLTLEGLEANELNRYTDDGRAVYSQALRAKQCHTGCGQSGYSVF